MEGPTVGRARLSVSKALCFVHAFHEPPGARRCIAILGLILLAGASSLGAKGCGSSGTGIANETCLVCHTGQNAKDMTSFRFGPHRTIRCEDCHGSGYLHVRNGGRGGLFIDSLFGLSSEKDLNICAECHVAEVAGYEDSQHYKKGVLTCLGCHDLHAGSKASPNVKNNDVCLRCHNDMGFGDDMAVEAHTFHDVDPVGTGASRCVTCHLPPLVRNDARLTHSLWPVSPRDTVEQIEAELNPRPNSCVGVPGCHDGTVVTAPVFNLESRSDNELARILYEERYGVAGANGDVAVK